MARSPHPLSVKFHSERCYRIAQRIWEWTLVSVLIDFLILRFSQEHNYITESVASTGLIFMGLAGLGFFREEILRGARAAGKYREKILTRYSSILICAAVVLSLGEIALRASAETDLKTLLIILVIGAPVAYASYKKFDRMRIAGLGALRSNVSKVERANLTALSICVAPIFAARIASLLAAHDAVFQANPLQSYLSLGGAAVLLMMALKPDLTFFRAPCKHCQRMTSRALEELGACPNCAPEKFVPNSDESPSSLNSLKIWNIIQSARKGLSR